MHSTLFYRDRFNHRYSHLMPKIQKLARLRDELEVRGRVKEAAKVQARITRYTIEMAGDTPRFIDRYEHGTQLISLFGLEWEEVADDFTDYRGRMTPPHTLRLLSRLVAREALFARNASRVCRWWLFRNPVREWRLRRKYAALRAFLQLALKRKEVLGVSA